MLLLGLVASALAYGVGVFREDSKLNQRRAIYDDEAADQAGERSGG